MLRAYPLVPALLLAALAAQDPRPLPPLAEATRIHDGKTGAVRTWPELIEALAAHDVVFLGETHVDDTTHQVELHVLEQLLAKKQGKVVLTLEMFERDVQPVLDDYLQGRIDEGEFLRKARPWQNYRTAYRPLIEAAKAAKIPVVAANFPGTLRRAFAGGGGKAALDKLSPEQRALVPAEIFPASAAYWERVDRAVRGHMGGPGGGTPEERRYETQNLWDNAMGDNVARARAAHPDHLVLHVAGGFHVAYRDGTVAQFVRRSPDSKFAVVQIAPTAELHVVRPDRDRDQGDFVVYARGLARDFNEGNYAVSVPAELRYRFELPEQRSDAVPLLLWLADRTSRTEDALEQLRLAVGDRAAIAVVEAPFPELQADLGLGGRWAFGDGFRADYSRVSHGLVRIVEYLTRRHGLDGGKVVIAGHGDGGAAVLWTALYGEWLANDFVAIDPTDLGRLGMEALPDLKPVAKALHLYAQRTAADKLEAVAADYRQVGTAATVTPLPAAGLAAAVRSHLGLPPLPPTENADAPLFLVLEHDTPRARQWAELHVGIARLHGVQASVVSATELPKNTPAEQARSLSLGERGFSVDALAQGHGIPLAGGPFGGTTVIVLPAGIDDADRAKWLAHEQNKVLKRRNMFANIAIADETGDRALPAVLTKLKGMGRSRVLIVPAVFCAEAALMQRLQSSLGEAAAGMDVNWLPGLGAELAKMPLGK
jgi:uncharacterized iron-regulated protein